MKKIGKIIFKEIKRISPSQYCLMKNCAYKSVLAEAFGKTPLLPVSPNAYFGTVLHKMLELIAKKVIKSEEEFNKMFDEQVNLVEYNLQQLGYTFLVPLQKNVKDYGIKKNLLKKHLRAVSESRGSRRGVKYQSEKWLESKDKLIAGKIDLVIEADSYIEIIDFKSGEITEDVLDDSGDTFSEVREEYKEQLKLYAYLYFENTNRFPTDLSLVDLAKQKFGIEFTYPECSAISDEAKHLLCSTNENIARESFIANPSEKNCKFCLYRPACSFFLKYIETNSAFNDASGLVKNVVQYQNGNVSVFLENTNAKITITGLPKKKFEEINSRINTYIAVFNLRREGVEDTYSATKTTTIYEY